MDLFRVALVSAIVTTLAVPVLAIAVARRIGYERSRLSSAEAAELILNVGKQPGQEARAQVSSARGERYAISWDISTMRRCLASREYGLLAMLVGISFFLGLAIVAWGAVLGMKVEMSLFWIMAVIGALFVLMGPLMVVLAAFTELE